MSSYALGFSLDLTMMRHISIVAPVIPVIPGVIIGTAVVVAPTIASSSIEAAAVVIILPTSFVACCIIVTTSRKRMRSTLSIHVVVMIVITL